MQGWHKMSSNNERMTDLFIPVGRPQSSASSVRTNTSSNTATISAVNKSKSTSPATTVSTKKSTLDKTPARPKLSRPTSTRYTISGPAAAPEADTPACEPNVNKQPQNERPNTVYVRRHSRSSSLPTSPVRELTVRLSNATSPPKAESNSPVQIHTPPPIILDTSRLSPNKRGSVNATTPPLRSNMTVFRGLTESHSPGRDSDLPMTNQSKQLPKTEAFASALVNRTLFRSHSQSSSRSERKRPPPAFPVQFYDKSVNQNSYEQSPPRSSHEKPSMSSSSTRSTSPLKYSITSQEYAVSNQLATQRPRHRRQQSDSSVSVRSQLVISSNASRITSIDQRRPFHTTIHYYESCPHTSPPSTRPLNAPPKLDTGTGKLRSVISGSCFDCETIERRDVESSILQSFNSRIEVHTSNLEFIMLKLESMSPVSPLSPPAPNTQMQRLSLNDALSSDKLGDQPELEEQENRQGSSSSLVSEREEYDSILIRHEVLQDRIAELTQERDKEVKDLWKGYSERWGPGTLGLLKSRDLDRVTLTSGSSTPSSRRSLESSRSRYAPAEGRMKVDWIRQ